MLKRLLTLFRRPDPPAAPPAPRIEARVSRLEIEIEDLVSKLEAVWARQRKVEGTVHGMRGANARHPSRLNNLDETLEQYRERMLREGRLVASRGDTQHGEH